MNDVRDSLEKLIDSNRRIEAENKKVQEQNKELQAKLAELAGKYEKVKIFESLITEVPNRLQVYITDPRVAQQIIATAVKYHGPALGNPEHSEDSDTRKRARANVTDVVEACCKFGMTRFADVFSLYLSNPTRRL